MGKKQIPWGCRNLQQITKWEFYQTKTPPTQCRIPLTCTLWTSTCLDSTQQWCQPHSIFSNINLGIHQIYTPLESLKLLQGLCSSPKEETWTNHDDNMQVWDWVIFLFKNPMDPLKTLGSVCLDYFVLSFFK